MFRIDLKAFAVALLLGSLVFNAESQVVSTPVFAQSADGVRTAIHTGYQLERDSKWRDAVKHYKEATKVHPDSPELTHGLRRSRFQLKIERRHLDESFEFDLCMLPKDEALDLYEHVAKRVLNEYTEYRNATTFLAHGTEDFYLALTNRRFVEANLKDVPAAKRLAMRDWLRKNYWNKPVETVAAARLHLTRICGQAQRELGIDATPVILEYLFGGCNSLDKYSACLTPNQLDDLYGDIEGEFVGIGIEMQAEEGEGLLLVDVLSGSPAEQGGMLPGDYIVAVDGVDIRTMKTDESAKLLRGPKNSTVKITLRDPVTDKFRTNTFTRRPVQIKSFPVVKMIEGSSVGYIKMTGFQRSSASELDAALRQLRSEGMQALVWDLRGNPGGLLFAAVECLDRFIDSGLLVETRGKHRDQNRKHRAGRIQAWDMPLVVLIDENSASASEIVAGAIRDHKRGTLVGRQSYGKWSVQTILNAPYGTGLRVTTAKFYSPDGHNYQEVGVKPDETVTLPEQAQHLAYRGRRNLTSDRDVQKGLDVLTSKLASR